MEEMATVRGFCLGIFVALGCLAPGIGPTGVHAEPIEFPAGANDADTLISRTPGDGSQFNDCAPEPSCPDMLVVPGSAKSLIGSPSNEPGRLPSESEHAVSIKPFAIGRHEVSVDEWHACVADGACRQPEWLEPGGPDNIHTGMRVTYKSLGESVSGGAQPIVGISWDDAAAYAAWLSKKTKHSYRLPSEAEWEHAARAQTRTPYWWGTEPKKDGAAMACCRGCGSERDGTGLYPVESFKPNPWGLFNVHGNVWEWVADYYCDAYEQGPRDGSARIDKTCPKQASPEGLRIFRGGSCFFDARQMRASMRLRNWPSFRNQTVGFRVARDLEIAR